MRAWLRRTFRKARAAVRLARREHSSPRELAWSVAVGVFCGCSPFIGAHMWMALGLATLLRLNRLWAFLGSRVSSSVMLYLLAFAEIAVGHKLRHGVWPHLKWREVLRHGGELFGDWLLGSVLVGATLGAALGLLAYGIAVVRARARARRGRTARDAEVGDGGDGSHASDGSVGRGDVSPSRPDEPLPPTSGSPPSARPEPSR